MSEVRFLVKIDVSDFDQLREAAEERGYDGAADDIAEIIDVVVINAEKAPVDTGFEIVSSPVASAGQENAYHIDFHLRITDEAAFVTEARRRYLACWGQDDWLPESLSEAGYEILVASNGNPESPLDIGFEIAGTKYYADLPLSPGVIALFSDDNVSELAVPGM
jgi:hypothetical protein